MEKPTIYLHVGPHKTGTTVIQKGLMSIKDKLLDIGYVYPRTGIMLTYGHHNLAFYLNEDEKYRKLFGNLLKLKRELVYHGKHAILSSECFDEITEKEPLIKFRRFMQSHFNFKVLMYLRRQDEMLISLWKSRIRMQGNTIPFPKWARSTMLETKFLDYEWWIGLYEEVFGEGNVIPIKYKKRNENLCSEFLSHCNIDSTISIEKEEKLDNVSFSNLTMFLLQMYFRNGNKKQRSRMRKEVIKKASLISGELEIEVIGKKLSQRIYDHYLASNNKVSELYFDSKPLFPDYVPTNKLRTSPKEVMSNKKVKEVMIDLDQFLKDLFEA